MTDDNLVDATIQFANREHAWGLYADVDLLCMAYGECFNATLLGSLLSLNGIKSDVLNGSLIPAISARGGSVTVSISVHKPPKYSNGRYGVERGGAGVTV